jgi:TolA-binding protein
MSNLPTRQGMPNIDFKQFGPMPQAVEGGPQPMFMGKAMAGPDMDQMAGQIGNALESIKEGLTSSEEGIKEMKDGQIKVDPAMEKSVTGARPIYDAAIAAFQAGDYKTAATKLQEIQKVGFDKKYAAFAESQGVSLDMIKDIRAQMNDGLKQISQIDDPAEQQSAQADIMTQMNYLDEAEKLMKQNKKKEAAQILKKMRQASGVGSADAAMAGGKGKMGATQIGKVLDQINTDLTRAGSGLEKAKDRGIAVSSELQDAMDKTKALYEQAKAAYDAGDYTKAAEVLKQMKDSKLKELSMSYRDKMLPPDRLQSILQEGKNGSKALKIAIDKAKEYGVDTAADLEGLSAQLDALLQKAEEALNAKETDLFLTIMGQAEELNVRDRVDSAIRTVAEGRAKEILGQGLTAVKTAIDQLNSAVEAITSKGGAVANAKDLISQASAYMAKSQSYYDQGDYMSGGRQLDDAAIALIKAGNILRDSGAKISKEQLGSTDSMIKTLNDAGDLSNTDSNMMGKAQSLLSNMDEGSIMESKQTIMQFNPGLLDKVLAFRQKDQKLIDDVINEVMPLVPERDRQAMMEGKINLLEESVSAGKTIKVMQSLKGLNKSTIGDLQNIAKQAKDYNFITKVVGELDEKISDLNDKIQSGEVKDPKMVDNYVKALKQEFTEDMKVSQDEKFKQKMIPAKNIDDNNPLFEEIKYLKDDGAIATDKNGNINVGQVVSGKVLADIVNKTQDKNAMKPLAGSKITVKDAAQKIIESYGVKTQANPANAAQFIGYLNKLGADIKQADLNKPANLGQIAEIVAAADQEWGNK